MKKIKVVVTLSDEFIVEDATAIEGQQRLRSGDLKRELDCFFDVKVENVEVIVEEAHGKQEENL